MNLVDIAVCAGVDPIEFNNLISFLRTRGETADPYAALSRYLDTIATEASPVQRVALASELCGRYAATAIKLMEARKVASLTERSRPWPFQKIISIFNPTSK